MLEAIIFITLSKNRTVYCLSPLCVTMHDPDWWHQIHRLEVFMQLLTFPSVESPAHAFPLSHTCHLKYPVWDFLNSPSTKLNNYLLLHGTFQYECHIFQSVAEKSVERVFFPLSDTVGTHQPLSTTIHLEPLKKVDFTCQSSPSWLEFFKTETNPKVGHCDQSLNQAESREAGSPPSVNR